MIIKEINCEQFAGLNNKYIKFENGLNVILGNNETGKSTIADLIYSLLFQNIKKDKKFNDKYLPKTNSNIPVSFMSGSLIVKTEKGTYNLKKEWDGAKGVVKFTLPDGTIITDSSDIEKELADILKYGKAIYDELIFPSQKRSTNVLKALLSNKPKKDEVSQGINSLSSSLSKTVSEMGGINIGKIEAKLEEKMKGLSGHWDFDSDMPEGGARRGINNQWKKDVGAILSAYYEKESLKGKLDEIKKTEEYIDELNSEIKDKDREHQKLKEKQEKFQQVKIAISEKNNNEKLLANSAEKCCKYEKSLSDWPKYEEQLLKAYKIIYREVKKIRKQEDDLQVKIKLKPKIDDEELNKAKKLSNEIDRLSNLMNGMSVTAHIDMIGSHKIEINSILDKKKVDINNGKADITEAVNIFIPDVANIKLVPQSDSMEDICESFDNLTDEFNKICKKHNVSNYEELEELSRQYKKLAELQKSEKEKLGNLSLEKLANEFGNTDFVDNCSDETYREKQELCGNQDIKMFIGNIKSRIDTLKDDYGSINELKNEILKIKQEIENYERKIHSIDDIPEEFNNITNSDEYERNINNDIENCGKVREELKDKLFKANATIDDTSAEEYEEKYQTAENLFCSKKEEYDRWKHIKKIFDKVKEANYKNPTKDIEDSFKKYLSIISHQSIALENMNDKIGVSIASNSRPLSFEILSEGTKDTISLAFRLAVLEQLYPQGSCISVFDDPFTDMDLERRNESCKLIKKFAEKNQIILITCNQNVANELGGNIIRF